MKDTLTRRLILIIIVVGLIFSILVVRITKLMIFNKQILIASSESPRYHERGFILDRNGQKLALSLKTYSVYARPEEVENKKETAQRLARILETDYSWILKKLNQNTHFVWIKRQLDLKYSEKLEKMEIQGIYIQPEYKRFYPFNNLGSHVIGFSGVDNVGLEGIEYYFDSLLLPRRIDQKGINYSDYQRGYSVVLTIDRFMQDVVEEELEKAYTQTGARYITAVVMNPNNGEIYALANKPDYNLNQFTSYPDEIKRNKAITDTFEPGSTFKPFVASILLNEGTIESRSQFMCRGEVTIKSTTIHDTGTHGIVDLTEILEKSCNVGMVKMVDRIDRTTLYQGLRAYGFGSLTGLNLPGEARGILRKPKSWSTISKYEIAIGQEVAVTPIQLITAASALANGGVLMHPRIVKQIQKPDGTVLKNFPSMEIRRVVHTGTAHKILEILSGVLTPSGTGYKAHIEGYSLAGKTGTAQIADLVDGGYLENQFYASFLGFVPASDPRMVVLVTLDQPKGEVYGGQIAAPIFKRIVEKIAPYMNILPRSGEVYVLREK
ncbi:MAG: peptidoglycan D,D-transpeptidase FtsI family protein [Spirochaetota bacterium]